MSEFQKDKTGYWNLYFPARNNKIPNFKVNRNFDNETLHYASSAKAADSMTVGIIKRMRGRKFFVIECCAGIGGNTTSFLNSDQIYGVRAYERNPMRRLWLKRNIMAYGFGNKAMVPDIPEEGLTSDEDFSNYKEAVFFFDPPWLPPNQKGKDYKEHYILKDMKVGKRTLEQWLAKNKEIARLMVFRVPPKYDLTEVPGWTYEIEDMGKNGLVYYCFNNVIFGSNNASKTTKKTVRNFEDIKFKDIPFKNHGGFGEFMEVYDKCMSGKAKTTPECKVFLEWSFVDPEPGVERLAEGPTESMIENEILSATNTPPKKFDLLKKDNQSTNRVSDEDREMYFKMFKDLPLPKKKIDLNSTEWVREFQVYLNKLLSKFIDNEKIVNRLLDNEAMPHWIKAFTHITFDYKNNYEVLEKVGDALGGAAFIMYLYHTYPEEIDPRILSEVKSQIFSKPYQRDLSQLMRMGDWIRKENVPDITIDIYEDALESFTGALNDVGDLIKPGLGFVLIRNFTEYLFKNVTFDFNRIKYGLPKTIFIQQYIERIKLNKDQYELVPIGNGRTMQIILSDTAFERFKNYFPLLKSKIIGEGTGSSPAVAENEAYASAIRTLEAVGVTVKRIDEIKSNMGFDKLEAINPNVVKLVKSKYQKEGYTYVLFDIPASTQSENSRTAIMIGYMPDKKGNKEVKLSTGSGRNETEAQLDACQNYLDEI
jgi:dsRNA-specific ribonuclease